MVVGGRAAIEDEADEADEGMEENWAGETASRGKGCEGFGVSEAREVEDGAPTAGVAVVGKVETVMEGGAASGGGLLCGCGEW